MPTSVVYLQRVTKDAPACRGQGREAWLATRRTDGRVDYGPFAHRLPLIRLRPSRPMQRTARASGITTMQASE